MKTNSNKILTEKIIPVSILLCDVDGVLTKGEVIYSDQGIETKIFNVKDGLGIRLLINSGIDVGIITGRSSSALKQRCHDLGITLIYQGIKNKITALNEIIKTKQIKKDEIAFIGDDLPDLCLLNRVGFPVTVSDADETVKKAAAYITTAKGGCGAVREVCELILKSKGVWKNTIKSFM